MITVQVAMNRGPSPATFQVDTDDEGIACKVAYRFAYYGDTLADDSNTDNPASDAEIDAYTTVVLPVVQTLTPT